MITKVIWLFLLAGSVLLNVAARLFPGFAQWYGSRIYPFWVETLGRFCSLVPFSVIEVLIYGAVLAFLVGCGLVLLRKLSVRKALKILLKAGIVVFTLFTLNCGINYQRTPFSELAGFPIQKSSEEELVELCEFLVAEINEAAQGLSTDAEGCCQVEGDITELAREAMQEAGKTYSELAGYYPKAKPVFSTWYLSYQLLQGVYSPFTVEANYNNGMPDVDKPSTICHELSHLKGFMREDEANFISWLACRSSENQEFRYSGNILAYIYAGNALYKQNPEAFREIRSKLCEQGIRDLQGHNAYWDPFRGPVAEVSDKMNDAYLKANAQQDGVKSYGRMVDLLLAWKRST